MAERLLLSKKEGLLNQQLLGKGLDQSLVIKGQSKSRRITVGFSKSGMAVIVLLLTFLLTITIVSHQRLAGVNRSLGEQQEKLEKLEIEQNNLKEEKELLTRYDRISQIAKEHGMTLKDEQVRTIANEK
ncbi:cell division protein FtsL [Atopobacter sp. AH10]|uniref:cell division protein FtsL n=1 Tax=Atopobacter sp. AH10 TaxID=2315861 RepID=UPI000EF271A9|nr:cell division protein FtsL [Atopobacter sp. AH10]RLK62940.1 cell division protein FtsL [Atopobacter sp. AH10]